MALDEDKKHYLLSCEHVIHPDLPEVSDIIVQPSIEDFREDVREREDDIRETGETLKCWRSKQNVCEERGDLKAMEKWNKRIAQIEENLRNKSNDLDKLGNEKYPREIAKYSWGVQKNITKEVPRRDCSVVEKEFWVDAAVAELVDDEEEELKAVTTGTVRGFRRKSLTSGEIVPMLKFEEETETGVVFRKSGRTTQHTEGQLYNYPFSYNRYGFKKETCFGVFTNTHFKTYCQKCCPPNHVEILEVSTVGKENYLLKL